MNENPQQELPLWNESKLATSCEVADNPRSRALAGAVRDLAGKDLGPDTRNALVRKVRSLFPELMELKGDQDAEEERKGQQIQQLGPFLKGMGPFLEAGGTAPTKGSEEAHNTMIDLSARLMWELSETERKLEAFKTRETALRGQILGSVRPEHLPLVRWALDQA